MPPPVTRKQTLVSIADRGSKPLHTPVQLKSGAKCGPSHTELNYYIKISYLLKVNGGDGVCQNIEPYVIKKAHFALKHLQIRCQVILLDRLVS